MVAPISTQGWNQTQGAGRNSPLTTNAKGSPGPGRPSPVYTCSFHPREHRERDLPGSAFFFPRWATGRGCGTITTLAHASLCPCSLRWPGCPSHRGAARGPQAGEGRGASSPLLWVCWGKVLHSSGLAGPASLCPSVLSFSGPLKNKTNQKEKKKTNCALMIE